MKIPVLNPTSQGVYPINLFFLQETTSGRAAMVRTPGLTVYYDFGISSPVRAMYTMNGYLYIIIGNKLYRKFENLTNFEFLGLLSSNSGDCWIQGNGNQVMVIDSAVGWVYDAQEKTLSQITDPDFFNAICLAYHDGYFIVGRQNSDEWQCDKGHLVMVSPYDVTDCFDTLDYEASKKAPGNIRSIISALGQVWVFKENSNQIYFNKGGASFPFSFIPGAANDVGLAAAHTLVELDNSLMWLDDKLMVRRAFSYNGSFVVSTPKMTEVFQSLSVTSDARAFQFNWHGNVFYVITFPYEKITYVYNCTTSIQRSSDLKADVFWHKWTSYPDDGRHRSNCYAYFEGKHLVGDYQNGKIYKLDGYSDDGHEIKSVLTYPVIEDNGMMHRHGKFIQFMKNGVGLLPGAITEEPKCMMQYSDDGGSTWAAESWVDIGKMGERYITTEWRRLGRTKQHGRIYRTIITDPVEVEIYGAEVK